jgi:Flp pilus assembly protein TadD
MRRLTAMVAAWLIVLGLGIGSDGAASAQGLADVRLGNEAFRQGDFATAVRHYTDAIRSGELVGEALAITYNNRGVAHGEAGDFDPAIADYSQAMALRPGDATTVRNLRVAHVRRGELHFASGAYDDAVADFTQAISLEPEHHLAYQRRGELYTELGLIDLAVDDLERAMLLSPGDAEITTALERAMAQRERLAGSPTTGEPAAGDLAAADPALPELPALAETPAAALPSAAPSDTAEAPAPEEPAPEEQAAEDPVAEEPVVAAVPTPAPRELPADLEPSAAPAATAERVIDMTPAAPTPSAAATPEPAPAPTPSPAPAAPAPAAGTTTAAAEGEPYRVVSAVNYRAGPDNDAQRLGTVDAGRIVRVTGDTLGWKHVVLPNGDRGFIYGSWLEPAGN